MNRNLQSRVRKLEALANPTATLDYTDLVLAVHHPEYRRQLFDKRRAGSMVDARGWIPMILATARKASLPARCPA